MSARFRGRRRIVTVTFLLFVVVFAVSWRGVDTVYDWFSRTSTLEWRFELWRDTLAIVRDFRWFGTGLNTYGVSTLVYPMSDVTRHAMEAHSDYVQILSEGGIVLAVAAAVRGRAARARHSRRVRATADRFSLLGANRCHARPDRDGDSGTDRLQPADARETPCCSCSSPPSRCIGRPGTNGPAESGIDYSFGRFPPVALRIGFDLDGVLADMEGELVRQAEILFGEPMTRRVERRTAPDSDGCHARAG